MAFVFTVLALVCQCSLFGNSEYDNEHSALLQAGIKNPVGGSEIGGLGVGGGWIKQQPISAAGASGFDGKFDYYNEYVCGNDEDLVDSDAFYDLVKVEEYIPWGAVGSTPLVGYDTNRNEIRRYCLKDKDCCAVAMRVSGNRPATWWRSHLKMWPRKCEKVRNRDWQIWIKKGCK